MPLRAHASTPSAALQQGRLWRAERGVHQWGVRTLDEHEPAWQHLARVTQEILELAPAQFAADLRSLADASSTQAHWAARTALIVRVLEVACSQLPAQGSSSQAVRAACPLCSASRTDTRKAGFLLPKGLRMHLEGHGRSLPCVVLRAAYLQGWRWRLVCDAPRGTK